MIPLVVGLGVLGLCAALLVASAILEFPLLVVLLAAAGLGWALARRFRSPEAPALAAGSGGTS